jgi:hypothetical protein
MLASFIRSFGAKGSYVTVPGPPTHSMIGAENSLFILRKIPVPSSRDFGM